MNYTFNLGRPIGKVLTYGICLAVGALFLWMFLLFLKMDFTPIRLTITGENVSITSGYTDADFQLRDIEEIHLLDQLPAESFTKTNAPRITVCYLVSSGEAKRETAGCM